MKTTKRVLAIALAVLMLALAIPFSASAAQTENNTLDLYAGKPDVTFNVPNNGFSAALASLTSALNTFDMEIALSISAVSISKTGIKSCWSR